MTEKKSTLVLDRNNGEEHLLFSWIEMMAKSNDEEDIYTYPNTLPPLLLLLSFEVIRLDQNALAAFKGCTNSSLSTSKIIDE
jgi:hypothetical protein